jgi:hypothetical protein
MNRVTPIIKTLSCLSIGCVTAWSVTGASDLDDEVDHAGWFLRAGARVTSGMKASMRDLKAAPSIVPGSFDNGYVQPDVSGNSKSTWNWGYNSASQVQGDTLVLSRLSGTPRVGNIDSLGDVTQYGGELALGFEFFRFNLAKREAKFGWEFGYAFSQFNLSQHSSASGSVAYDVSRYALNGVNAPLPPYAGSFNGPGPVIALQGTSDATVVSTASSTLDSHLESDLHIFRFGPWIEVPISGRMSATLGFGYATIYANPHLNLSERLSISNPVIPGSSSNSGRYSRSAFVPGAFSQLRINYRLTKLVGLYLGGEFQYNTGVTVAAPTRSVRLDFGSTYGAVGGVNLSF